MLRCQNFDWQHGLKTAYASIFRTFQKYMALFYWSNIFL